MAHAQECDQYSRRVVSLSKNRHQNCPDFSGFHQRLRWRVAPGNSTRTAFLTGVQGYAGLGPPGNQFTNFFLRSATANVVTLSLSNLPPHRTLTLTILFAAIDSLDGTGSYPAGDFLKITLATNVIFPESFANADPGQTQSYIPPPGRQLARRVDLGFSGPGGYWTDSAYDFGVDPRFQELTHTNSSAVITFQIEGVGIQDLADESWAMENLGVSVTGVAQPVITLIEKSGINLMLAWTAVSNVSYRVQSKTHLTDAGWEDLQPSVTATSSLANYSEPLTSNQRFYRVMGLP
jgi:hypothetical protein